MNAKMSRGKQQILFNYLPGKTFDFDKINVLSIMTSVDGEPNFSINVDLVLKKISSYALAWKEKYRPVLRDDSFHKAENFILIDPNRAKAEIFPLVFWCNNPKCGRIYDFSTNNSVLPENCLVCKSKLIQLRWVKVHRCGSIKPLNPPYCSKCKSDKNYSLDTRDSQRISGFTWICRGCGRRTTVFADKCNECNWDTDIPNVSRPGNYDIDVIRAGRTYYPHYVVLLNIVKKNLNHFINTKEWPEIAAASFFEFEELRGHSLLNFVDTLNDEEDGVKFTITPEEEKRLLEMGNDSAQIEILKKMQQELNKVKEGTKTETRPAKIAEKLIERTGVEKEIWDKVGQEILEAIVPLQNSTSNEIYQNQPPLGVMGTTSVTLVNDFPILIATFGYSRVDFRPNLSRLNPFPSDRNHGGKFPIYIDTVQADAIFFKLDPEKIISWLKDLGYEIKIPRGSDETLSRKAYFVKLFDDVSMNLTIKNDKPIARIVFGLVHTLSHMLVRQAAILCGLEQTNLSEYILPRTLTIGIYSNHRFGATIGALTSLFEQSIDTWLGQVVKNKRCVYDPVCKNLGGNCHSCLHLTESSCRYFNLNLSRAFLFGGEDSEVGNIEHGFFDFNNAGIS